MVSQSGGIIALIAWHVFVDAQHMLLNIKIKLRIEDDITLNSYINKKE